MVKCETANSMSKNMESAGKHMISQAIEYQ